MTMKSALHRPDALETTILLVDDDPAVLRACAAALRRHGWSVDAVTDGAAALSRLAQGGIDAIVSDLSMPQMSGIDLLRRVRELDMDLPVVLLTGAPDLQSAIRAVEHGAFRYLTKPVSPTELVETLARAVKLSQLARLKREAVALLGGAGATIGDRAALAARFQAALGRIWMAFQPIISWKERRVVAYEALLRSDEPAMRSPGEILEAAERLGATAELGRIIRRRVAEAAPIAPPDAQLFVNLHSLDLVDEDLFAPDAPLSLIANRVVLEVTERASLQGTPTLPSRLAALRQLGFRLAVDDLGAGYAGLGSFTVLEPELVKLDMSLVRDLHRDDRRQRIVRAMVELCGELGVLVVAEGVETLAEREVLTGVGCDLLQGYFFARPGAGFEGVAMEG